MLNNYYLSLGSNIEPRRAYLKLACQNLQKLGMIVRKSALYETEPWGKPDQANFYNAVLEFKTDLNPQELLISLKKIEKKIGRSDNLRWGPREIDIDILLCGEKVVNDQDLQIPHPEFLNRRFVLEPMKELNENLRPTAADKTIAEFAEICQDPLRVNKLEMDW